MYAIKFLILDFYNLKPFYFYHHHLILFYLNRFPFNVPKVKVKKPLNLIMQY